jgi:hypothetical protein
MVTMATSKNPKIPRDTPDHTPRINGIRRKKMKMGL